MKHWGRHRIGIKPGVSLLLFTFFTLSARKQKSPELFASKGKGGANFGGPYTRWVCYTSHCHVLNSVSHPGNSLHGTGSVRAVLEETCRMENIELSIHARSFVLGSLPALPQACWTCGFIPSSQKSWSPSKPWLLSSQRPLVHPWAMNWALHVALGCSEARQAQFLLFSPAFPALLLLSLALGSKGTRKKWKLAWPLTSSTPERKPWEVKSADLPGDTERLEELDL